MSLDPAQQERLERARAITVARDDFGMAVADTEIDVYPFGVAVRDGDRGCVVVSSDDLAVLGGVLVWARRGGLSEVALVVDHHPGIHARRVAVIKAGIEVYEFVEGRVTLAKSAPLAGSPSASASASAVGGGDLAALVALIERSGAHAVVEAGILRAEVAGLEVGRVVVGDGGAVMEVGIGRFDREAGALLHHDRAVEQSLVEVVEMVAQHRRRGVAPHSINRIGRERWLREEVRSDPAILGLVGPELVEPIPPRRNLLEAMPAALVATDDAKRVLVVCSVGADLGLVPATADLVRAHRPDEVCFVLPRRDLLPHLESLVGLLPVAARLVGIDPPWLD